MLTLRRYEVIYYATFLIDTVPVAEVRDPGAVPMLEIKTLEGNELVKLVRGWPVDFSKDKIAVLNEHGTEVLIDRNKIWRLEFDQSLAPFRFRNPTITRYAFAHPYAFASCPLDVEGATAGGAKRGGVFTVYPQQLLNDPVSIKRELDRFAEGHQQIKQYEIDQDFYARPEIYENETQLGMWLAVSSRYGASHDRANNFTPYLVNDFSAGPFGFQSELKTGAGPLLQTIHEEPQTQMYYRLKADYFHFTGMVDPNLLLVGQKYKWSAGRAKRPGHSRERNRVHRTGLRLRPLRPGGLPGGRLEHGRAHGRPLPGRWRRRSRASACVGRGYHWFGESDRRLRQRKTITARSSLTCCAPTSSGPPAARNATSCRCSRAA